MNTPKDRDGLVGLMGSPIGPAEFTRLAKAEIEISKRTDQQLTRLTVNLLILCLATLRSQGFSEGVDVISDEIDKKT